MNKDNIISFSEFKSNKEAKVNYQDPLPGSEEILDLVDEYFDVGVFIGIIDDKIQVTATTTDIEDVIAILETALGNIEQELGYSVEMAEEEIEETNENPK